MIDLLIFDHDMTIVDSSDAVQAGFNALARSLGKPEVSKQQVIEGIALPLRDFVSFLFGECREEWVEQFRTFMEPLEKDLLRPFPETESVLQELRNGGKVLAVATNRHNVRSAMEKSGIAHYFDAIVGPADGLPFKPNPAMLLHLVDRFGVDKDKTVYVGDSDVDMRAGTSAGIRTVGVAQGHFSADRLLGFGAWRALPDLNGLPSLVASDAGE